MLYLGENRRVKATSGLPLRLSPPRRLRTPDSVRRRQTDPRRRRAVPRGLPECDEIQEGGERYVSHMHARIRQMDRVRLRSIAAGKGLPVHRMLQFVLLS